MAYSVSPFDGSMTAAVGGRVSFPSGKFYGEEFEKVVGKILVTNHISRPEARVVLGWLENFLGKVGETGEV